MPYAPDSYPRQIPQFKVHGRGEITVSAKGIVTGDSNIPNDGADFGPDTMLGATASEQYGPPYTQTMGIMEAHAYAQTHKGAVVKFTTGNSTNGSPYYIDIPLKIGQKNSEQVIWEFNGFVSIHPSNNFTAGNPMIIVGNSGLPSPDIHMYGQRVQINGYNPSGTSVAASIFSFQGLGSGQIAYYFTFEECQMNSVQSGGSLIENIGIMDRPVIMRGMVFQGGGYNFFNNTSLCAVNFIDCAPAGAVVSKVPSGGTAFMSFIRGVRPGSLSLSSTGGEHIIIFENSGVAGPTNLITASGFSAGNPCTIFFYGDCDLLLTEANTNFFQIGDYVNIFADNIRFALNTSSGTSYIINPTSTGQLNGTIFLGKIRLRNVTSGGTLSFAPNLNAITQTEMVEAFIVEQATGTVNNVYPPSISTNPPVTATVYQNNNPYDIEIDLPVYATTSGTAGYVTVAKGATSTPATIGNQYVNGATSSTSVDIIKLRVPAGWYYSFTASGVTFGTASVFAD